MPDIEGVQRRIAAIEGFEVVIFLDGRNVHDNRKRDGLPRYSYNRAAKNEWKVSDWIVGRFKGDYRGFDVEVLYGNGSRAPGQTQLGTVRDSYGS